MQLTCTECNQDFSITQHDLDFYKKIDVPVPTLCLTDRHKRRIAFRNQRKLYKRSCDKCGASIISMYSSDKKLVVFCATCYWSDDWDALTYGKDFDFNKPFFEQFATLLPKVPLLSSIVLNCVNCDYTNYSVNAKDSYLSTRLQGEGILYSYLTIQGLHCTDCYNTYQCQYCYECVDCWNCYKTFFSQQCRTTNESAFCYDCIGCNNCFGCTGLRNKQYCFFNKQCTKEEYEKLIAQYNLGTHSDIIRAREKFVEIKKLYPHRPYLINNSQNAQGDYISDSKDVFASFDIEKTDTAHYCTESEYAKDIFDCDFIYYGENCYENISNTKSSNIRFSYGTWTGVHDVEYSMMCVNDTHDCFGVLSLKRKQFCILNKQYSEQEYRALVPKIIAHMKKTGEYGQFFPVSLSPFGYNETVAQDYFPLTQDQARAKGYSWHEENSREYASPSAQVPRDIKDVADSIVNEILACELCCKNYKIIHEELAWHRTLHLALPRRCLDCRFAARLAMRNPRKLWQRECAKCKTTTQTTYAPNRPEIVYCEKCYLQSVY